ncbi:hypothetical protein CEXT_430621 [Caerostris extrusa]|uniref:Uncharacterized protein n=1 Tax=Caerostris extrusa TaxID=172846 RepID=A0AAV4V9S8_CAEEX|nr:hypothetical protein CEXT_430621 [Caerostris extrusa]
MRESARTATWHSTARDVPSFARIHPGGSVCKVCGLFQGFLISNAYLLLKFSDDSEMPAKNSEAVLASADVIL